jgi:hypothetical protein
MLHNTGTSPSYRTRDVQPQLSQSGDCQLGLSAYDAHDPFIESLGADDPPPPRPPGVAGLVASNLRRTAVHYAANRRNLVALIVVCGLLVWDPFDLHTDILIPAAIVTFIVIELLRSESEHSLWTRLSYRLSMYTDERNLVKDVFVVDLIRRQFADLVIRKRKVSTNHTHGAAAAARTEAIDLMELTAFTSGLKPYMFQTSRTDQRIEREGIRTFVSPKDVMQTPQLDELHKDSFMTLVDTAAHLDMHKFLNRYVHPTLVYDAVPHDVGGHSNGQFWYFDSESVLHTHVSGGASMRQKIHKYGTDHLAVYSRLLFGLGPVNHLVTYAVERRNVGKHRDVTLLVPTGHWKGLAAFLEHRKQDEFVTPLSVTDGRFTVMHVNDKGTPYVSIGLTGSPFSVRVDSKSHAAASCRIHDAKSRVPLSVASIKGYGITESQAAQLVTSYFGQKQFGKPLAEPDTCIVPPVTRTYQPVEGYDPDVKFRPTQIMRPLLDAAIAPDASRNNEEEAVRSRVTSIANEVTHDPIIARYASEFATHILRDFPGHVFRVDLDEVELSQNRPSQRVLFDRGAQGEFDDPVTRSFPKNEAYDPPKPVRIISTVPPEIKITYSQFTKGLSNKLKPFKWYAFGQVPREIASQVASVCSGAISGVLLTDYSRMDGRVNAFSRLIVQIVMLTLLDPTERTEYTTLCLTQCNRKAQTRLGVKYDTGSSRLSGSPETSLDNTALNAIIIYAAFRISGLDPAAAWHALNEGAMCGGDDGLTADLDPDTFIATALRFGQVVTHDYVVRGTMGINFLARMYGPDVWYGDNNSMCSPMRTFGKFHLSATYQVGESAEAKAIEKLYALSLSDSQTPVVKQLTNLYIDPHAPRRTGLELARSSDRWHSQWEGFDQFPNDDMGSGWMEEVVREDLGVYFDLDLFFAYVDEWTAVPRRLPALTKLPKFGIIKEHSIVGMVVDGTYPTEKAVVVGSASRKDRQAQNKREGTPRTYKFWGGSTSGRFQPKNVTPCSSSVYLVDNAWKNPAQFTDAVTRAQEAGHGPIGVHAKLHMTDRNGPLADASKIYQEVVGQFVVVPQTAALMAEYEKTRPRPKKSGNSRSQRRIAARAKAKTQARVTSVDGRKTPSPIVTLASTTEESDSELKDNRRLNSRSQSISH